MTVDGFSSPPPPRRSQRVQSASLHMLAGVHLGDSQGKSVADNSWEMPCSAQIQKIPGAGRGARFRFTAKTLSTAIFILIAALAASLTLLVIQFHNFESVSLSQISAASSTASDSSKVVPFESPEQEQPHTATEPDDEKEQSEKASGGAQSSSSQQQSPPASPETQDGRIDINTADATQLDAVKGIGPAIAQKIIDYRATKGPFKNVDGLLAVPGIGAKTLGKMRDQLVVR